MKLSRLTWPMLITLLGAYMRWHRLGDMRLHWDHAYPIAQAQMLLSTGQWPALGQVSSFFFSNPPGQAYISLLPLAVLGTSWGVYWFVTGLNVLAVPLLYRLGREVFDEREALIGAFLFAVSPWVVLYSRATWSSAILPVSTVLLMTWLVPALVRPSQRHRAWHIFAAFVVLTVFTQTYLLALLIVPVQVGLLLLLRFKHVPWRAVWAGSLVLAAGTGIFGWNLIRDWPTQSTRLATFSRVSEDQIQFKIQAVQLAVRYVTGLDYRQLDMPDSALPPILSTLAQACGWALAAALIVGVGLALRSCWRRDREVWANAALLLWWLTPIVLLSINNHELYPWHLRLSLPAGHLLAARSLRQVWGRQRWSSPLMLAGGVFAAAVSCATFNFGNVYNAAHPASLDLDRITLGTSLRLGNITRQLADQYNVNEGYAGIQDPDLTAWSQRPLTTVSWFIDPDLLIVPQDRPALYLRLGHGEPPTPLALAQRVDTLAFPGGDFVVFDVFSAMDRATMAALPQTRLDWPSDTGLTLLGYTWSDPLRAERTVTLTTYWLIENLTDDRIHYIYGPYLHLDAVDGSTHLNVSGVGLPGYLYRLSDLYIQPIAVTVPADARPGEYQLELGLYDGLHTIGTTFHPPDDVPRPYYTTSVVLP